MSETIRKRIRDLPSNPAAAAVYRRSSGEIFIRLNERFHVRGRAEGGNWIGDGTAEQIDANEEVEVIEEKTGDGSSSYGNPWRNGGYRTF